MSAHRILGLEKVPRVRLFAGLKRYASWVQNVARQFGPLSSVGVGELKGLIPSTRGPELTLLWVFQLFCQEHRWAAMSGRDKR